MTQEELDALMAGDLEDVLEVGSQIKDKAALELEKKLEAVDGHEHKHFQDEHLVTQLDEVTQESEKKATEVFDKLDVILAKLDGLESVIDDKQALKGGIDNIRNVVFEIMSIMQYQDIHRQKIERVINTMSAISRLMNDTLDSVRTFTPSAKHIAGDKDTEDLVDNDDIEALIASMNK